VANDKTTYPREGGHRLLPAPGRCCTNASDESVKVDLLTAITDAEAGNVTVAAYAGYAAQDCGYGASANNGGTEQTVNAANIDFPAIVGADVTVVGLGIKDHLGNYLIVKAIANKTFRPATSRASPPRPSPTTRADG
jgi:hypothetical protein